VADPAAMRQALDRAGAVLRLHGMMRDRRLDRGGELSAREELLRLRFWGAGEAPGLVDVGFKGPASRTAQGYKRREELEFTTHDGATAQRLFESLGYTVVQAIDRYVEVYELDRTVAQLEWFPRMDVLLEIEGEPEGIERVIRAAGLDRAACTGEPLASFADAYARRSGRAAILEETGLGDEPAGWHAA